MLNKKRKERNNNNTKRHNLPEADHDCTTQCTALHGTLSHTTIPGISPYKVLSSFCCLFLLHQTIHNFFISYNSLFFDSTRRIWRYSTLSLSPSLNLTSWGIDEKERQFVTRAQATREGGFAEAINTFLVYNLHRAVKRAQTYTHRERERE